jgi:hypothetical protein
MRNKEKFLYLGFILIIQFKYLINGYFIKFVQMINYQDQTLIINFIIHFIIIKVYFNYFEDHYQ